MKRIMINNKSIQFLAANLLSHTLDQRKCLCKKKSCHAILYTVQETEFDD